MMINFLNQINAVLLVIPVPDTAAECTVQSVHSALDHGSIDYKRSPLMTGD